MPIPAARVPGPKVTGWWRQITHSPIGAVYTSSDPVRVRTQQEGALSGPGLAVSALEFIDVGKHYGSQRILEGIGLTVAAGEYVGLVGANPHFSPGGDRVT